MGKTLIRLTVVSLILMVVLAGCTFGDKPSEEIYKHLENAAKQEQDFAKDQQQVVEKEKKEQELYNKSIKLNMKKFDQIVSLAKQASKLADERGKLVQNEKEILHDAYTEFAKVNPLIEDIDDADLKKKANQLVDAMEKRHKAYGELYKDYLESIKYDKQLYDMLQQKDLKADALQKQVNKINKKYEEVNKEKQQFNQYTDAYNGAKKVFYKAADLNVTFEDEE